MTIDKNNDNFIVASEIKEAYKNSIEWSKV